jgi:hypothetical protein
LDYIIFDYLIDKATWDTYVISIDNIFKYHGDILNNDKLDPQIFKTIFCYDYTKIPYLYIEKFRYIINNLKGNNLISYKINILNQLLSAQYQYINTNLKCRY